MKISVNLILIGKQVKINFSRPKWFYQGKKNEVLKKILKVKIGKKIIQNCLFLTLGYSYQNL